MNTIRQAISEGRRIGFKEALDLAYISTNLGLDTMKYLQTYYHEMQDEEVTR